MREGYHDSMSSNGRTGPTPIPAVAESVAATAGALGAGPVAGTAARRVRLRRAVRVSFFKVAVSESPKWGSAARQVRPTDQGSTARSVSILLGGSVTGQSWRFIQQYAAIDFENARRADFAFERCCHRL
jgi:hypothetical protein